mgnify:CR=1 FL=1
MTPSLAADVWREALITTATVAAPFLVAGVVVGVAISLFQAATQIQEQALTFVPKLIALGVLLMVLGPWVLERMVTFSQMSIGRIEEIGKGSGQ